MKTVENTAALRQSPADLVLLALSFISVGFFSGLYGAMLLLAVVK